MANAPRPLALFDSALRANRVSPKRLLRKVGQGYRALGFGTAGGAEQLESRLLLAVFDPGGSGIGSLTPATLGLNPVDQVNIDINPSASGAKNDSIVVAGASSLNGLLNLRIANASALAAGQTYSLLTSGTGSLSGSFLSLRNIDAGSATLNFVAIQTSSELRLVVTDLPTPNATIVIDSSLTPSQQASKLAELTGWYATGSANAADATASTAGSLRTYGQKFVGSLTFSTDENAGTRFADIAIGDLNGNPARLVVSAGVVGLPTVGLSAYGSTTLRVNPNSDGTSRLSVNAFTAAGFALGDQDAPASLAGSEGKIGPVSFTGFTLGLSGIELTSSSFAGTVTITAATASLALGGSAATNDSSRFKIEATDLSVSVTLDLSFNGTSIVENPGSGAFSITAEEVTMEVRDVLTVKASGGIQINKYNDSLPASQTLVSIGEAVVEIPKLGLRGSFTPSSSGGAGVLIRGDGFAFGNLTIGLTDDINGAGPTAGPFLIAGGRLRVSSPSVTVTDFAMDFGPTGAITQTRLGSFGVAVGAISLTPLSGPSAARFNASATDLSITVQFPDGVTVTPGQPVVGSPSGLLITLGTLDITLGFVKLQGSDIEIDTAAGPDERFITIAGSIGATLDLAEFFSSSTSAGPNIQITGSAGGFAITGDGSFLPFDASSPAPYNDNPFNVRLLVQAGQVADVLDGVANLPDSLPRGAGASGTLDLRVTWPDFNTAPERFLMRISGDIRGTVGGASGLTLAFSVEDLRVDSQKLADGEFPIVGFTSIRGSVAGTIMGADFNGAILIGLVRFDSVGAVLDPDADLADIAATRLYVGARGGLTLPNGWGVNVQFAFSESGFLNFYLSSNVDIPLGTSGLSLTGLRGGVTFNATPLPNIDDPVDLRNSAFESPDDLTDEQWEEQVQQLVINQFGGTPGFVFELDQVAGQDWVGLFDDNADPGLYLPEAFRTAFLGAGIAVPRKAGVSSIQTLEAGVQWLLRSGDDAYIIDYDSNTSIFSVSQITFVLPFEIAAALPTGTDTATAGSVSANIDGQSQTLVQLFAQSGRVIGAGAIVEPGADDGEWTVTDGQVVYTLTVRGEAGSEILAVTGGDPTFESGAGMTIRIDAGFSLSSTGGSSAWRLDADAVIQFTVGGPSATKIILLGDLSVGPADNPTLSVDTRALIDLSQAGAVQILFLADFRVAPPAADASNPTPSAPVPFFSVYGNVVFSFVNGVFSFTLTGSQTRGVAVFDTEGLISSPLGRQRVLLGAPSSPSAMDGTGRLSVTFGNNRIRANFAAAISVEGIISASNVVSASGDFTVEFSDVNVGSLGSIKLPSALYGAARLTASLDNIEVLRAAGIEGNINLLLKINTTNTNQDALLFDPTTNADETISIARRSFGFFGDGNLSFKPPVVGSLFRMQITGAFGIDISADNGANLFIVGTMPVPIPGAALVGMTADVVGLVRIDGTNFAARLELGIQNGGGSAKFFSIGAALQLYINTAGTEASYTMPRDIAARLGRALPATLADRLVWSGTGDASIVVPARAPLISYSTDGATSSTSGGYLVIQGFGNLDILDPSSRTTFIGVNAAARLALQVDASNPAAIQTQFLFEITGNASLGGLIDINLNAGVLIATTFDVTGPLPRIASVNMAGLLQLSASASLANVITLSGSGSVRINTFSTPQTVAGISLEANSVSITVNGELSVGGVFKLNGSFTFVNNAQRIAITGNVELDLYVARVAVDLSAAIYKSVIVNGVETNSPGLVINVGISLNVDFLSVFEISGSGRLRLSTRAVDTIVDSAPAGQRLVPARIDASTPFVNINLAAAVNFLDLVTVNGTLDFTTINDTAWQPAWGQAAKRHWRISGSLTAAAGISFLGGAEARIGNARRLDGTLSGRQAVFYDTGEFDVDASLRVQVGPDEFNVNGRAYAFASYLRNASGQKILSFGGGAALGISVDVDLGETDFGLFTVDWGSITFSFDAVSVSFEYNGNTGEVSITPCVIGICKTFTLGFFKLPPGATQRPVVINLAGPESYTARTAADGPAGVYDETSAWTGGDLFINAGSRAAFRNISGSVIDEDFVIEPDGPFNASTGRQNLKITAFGQTQTRADVSSIQAIMGSGIDTVTVRAGVLVPITIDGGAGNDKITYSAAGVATIRGGDDNDLITAAGASGSSIDGGNGNDVITWLSGNGAAVSVTGGGGNDTFVATFTDLPDRIRLGRVGPEQFRVSKLDALGTALEFVSVTGGIETLRINARQGADELIVDDFDAAGMTAYLDVSRYKSGTRTVTTSTDNGTGQAPIYSNDADADSVIFSGRSVGETFVLTSPADTADQDGDTDLAEGLVQVARTIGSTSIYTLTIVNAVPGSGETLRINGLQGDDTLDASAVDRNITRMSLVGNAGNDTLRGSAFADTLAGDEADGSGNGNDTISGNAGDDTILAGGGDDVIDAGAGNDSINSGLGNDTVTGGTDTDTFIDAGGIDTLIETRDRDFFITSTRLVIGTVSAASASGFADVFSAADESENLAGVFEIARLTGGAAANTFVVGDVNGTVGVPGIPSLSSGQQWAGTITLDGLGGSDRYVVTVFGISNAFINVSDSGSAGTDTLRIYGSDLAGRIDSFLVRRSFVAALFDSDNNGSLEVFDRVNYTTAIEGGLTIDALAGDDRIVVDETSIATTLRGGFGRDLFQFGQIFGTERAVPAVAIGDEIPSVAILLGTPGGGTVTARLTPGPSTSLTAFGGDGDDSFVVYRTISPLNLRGEAGDDGFSVRAFEQVGGGGTTQGNTTVAGGPGFNLIEFVASAPIDIDGGEGTDTVRMLGTFRDDQYIVDTAGITGPGASVTFTNIEILEINSGDGNDEIFVRSTAANLRLVIYGGAGSDRIFVGAPVPGSASNPAFSNTLQGINGPVLVDGGPGDANVFGLSTALKLPTESDTPLPPGAGGMMTEEQPGDVDIVDIIATAETRALAGLMSTRSWPLGSSSLSVVTLFGLGMGGDLVQNGVTVPGGISLRRLEVVDTRLGSGAETITVSAVVAGATTLFRGGGAADVFNVSAADPGDALLVIYTDAAPGETFVGTAGGDRVDGRTASVPMVLDGGAGNDVLLTGSGDDAIAGGSGDDTISGGDGDDLLFGDSRLSTDRLTRLSTIFTEGLPDSDQAGSDIINPGAGFNIAFGDHGLVGQNNSPAGTFGPGGFITTAVTVRPTIGAADVITAFAAASPEFAGLPSIANGSDLVFGGAGRDTLNTGDGNDSIVGDHGSSTISPFSAPVTGGGSSPTPKPTPGGVTIGIDGRIIRTPARVVRADIVGASRPSPLAVLSQALLVGRSIFLTSTDPTSGDNDLIDAGAGDDVIIGGTGTDTIDAGFGSDHAFGDNARFDPAAPIAERFVSLFTTTPGAGNADRILGGEGSDVLMGQQGTDTIFAGSGDDDIIGGHNVSGGQDAADFIDAGAGDDVVIADNGSVVRDPAARSPRFAAPTGGSIYAADLEVALTTAGIPVGIGAAFVRSISQLDTGTGAPAGTSGNDVVAGGAGRDVILAGNGDDTVRGDSRLVESPGTPTTLARSLDATTDGDDYIEGNAGNDTIHGDLGQDDLVGGSSSFFGLAAASRADGSDTIFGGDGTATGMSNAGDTSATGAARDADTIAGDNADIFRIVDAATGTVRTFNYDAGATLRIVPRAVRLLDYTADSLPAGDSGAADTINAEAGNDTVYGMTGNDLIYGDGQDDDLIGGSGDDWIYGGTGADSILGDDGRLLTSRNGTAEPLFGLAASAQQAATAATIFSVPVFVTGTLLRTARLQGVASGGADVVFGGLGDDTIHGGGGNDAISGAEALTGFYTPPTVRPALVFNPSMRRFSIFQPGFALQKLPNFFLNFSSGPLGSPIDDGKDTLFGGHGNDWLVGGTSSDFLFGGLGDDVLNADDNLDTTFNGANNIADVGADAAPDIAFGGGGLDRMIANATNDRLIDWYLDFNQYISPFIQTSPTFTKNYTPNLITALTTLGAGLGMDTRLIEPDGELGIITSTDAQWIGQVGRPFNP